jgi:pyruvate formate lyase activating enzyme
VELLPYHTLGVDKWHELGLEYPLEGVRSPTNEEVQAFKARLAEAGVPVICSQ